MAQSKIRVTKTIAAGAFLAVAKSVGRICRQNGGGIYIKAFINEEGSDTKGKIDLKKCDRVYVEASSKEKADKVWECLSKALEEENKIYTKEMDVGHILGGSSKTKREVLSQFIGRGGNNLKRITNTERAYTKITCPEVEGEGFVIKVECRRRDALERLCDQVEKEMNRIVWGNQYGKSKTPEKKQEKDDTSSGSFAVAQDDWSESDDDEDEEGEVEEVLDERTVLLRKWIDEGVVGAGYVVSDTVLALSKKGYTKEEIDEAQGKVWDEGGDPEDIHTLEEYLPVDKLANRISEKMEEEEVKRNLEAKFRTKALGDAVMGAISGSSIDSLRRDRREFNCKRQEIAERKGVEFWEVKSREVDLELGSSSEEVSSPQKDEGDWEKTYANWQSQQTRDQPKDVVSTDSSWSKPLDTSEDSPKKPNITLEVQYDPKRKWGDDW